MLFGIFEIFCELLVELGKGVSPLLLALFNVVEFFFQARSVGDIENVAKVLHQKIGNHQSNLGRGKFSAQLLHVLPFLNG